jgi:hypothetical protein
MGTNTEYNGWSNYETWRVNLEFGFIDNPELYKEYSGDDLKDYVEEILELDITDTKSITLSYALAFIDNVNWYEITRYLKENC